MRNLFFMIFLVSCAHELPVVRPSWVEAVRSGEESLRVVNGSKVFYRRIAGSPDLSKQTSCNLVIMKAEEDLKKEFPLAAKVTYAVEVLYYDPEYKDCAVTISLSNEFKRDYEKLKLVQSDSIDRKIALSEKEHITEDEAAEIVSLRSELATRFAITGLTKSEFEKFSNDRVQLLHEKNLCSDAFRTDSYSIHGLTYVCWKGEILAGYCTSRDKQCWTKTP